MSTTTKDGKRSKPTTTSTTELSQLCRHFEFPEILLATNNFDESLVVGQGGFGKVYKGNILNGSSATVAAIKRLDSMSAQGAVEFWAEVEMLSKLRHCHLVSLIGYCNYNKEMILIYEYMPNGTLEDHLHKLRTPLSWIQRLKICVGAGRGLDYLHTGTGIEFGVIHRDVKSSNILLHESWAAKISDFGLSRIGPTNKPSTYVNTLVKGTFGYLDPNYFSTGRLTRKSDVYAFGVVLLEVLCRKRAVDASLDEELWGLVTWAQDSIREGKLKDIIDPDIRGQISTRCLKEFVRIAERCFHSNPKQRPTMSEVVVSLTSVLTVQEKINTSLQVAGRTIFGRMFDMFPFPSNGENSAQGDLKLSSNSKGNSRNGRDTIAANNKDFTIPKVFKFVDLKRATRNFTQDLLLGRDGFGDVFLGWVDKNTFGCEIEGAGIVVVVKRYKQDRPEWQKVVSVLGRLTHPNIISLIGYCNDKENECLVVYEYTQNKNYDHFLFGDARDVAKQLSWGARLKILIGVARGLAYMHSSRDEVIHRDVKTSNILLDQDYNAKLGGFELARFGPEIEKTYVSTHVMGTLAYVDPWYRGNGHLKSDIYSFGMIMLETLTGKHALNIKRHFFESLVNKSELQKLMDPRLEQNYSLEGAFECTMLALKCIAMDRKDRPASEEILWSLEQIYVNNNE